MYKISITGPESTGKSWLAENLAYVFDGEWVSEYAREYLENLQRPYNVDDIVIIARQQRQNEYKLAAKNPHFLFCDTDMLVCKIWCEVKYGFCPQQILDLYMEDDYQLYLLMNIDLPWVNDPLREHPHMRQQLFELYLNTLIKDQKPFEVISGLNGQRLTNAVQALIRHFGDASNFLLPQRLDAYKY